MIDALFKYSNFVEKIGHLINISWINNIFLALWIFIIKVHLPVKCLSCP